MKGERQGSTGRIMRGIGGFYYVETAEGLVECRAKGIFRKKRLTPLAGDEVRLEEEQGKGVIAEILPRKNCLLRPPVANLDQLLIVASTTQPVPSTLLIDKISVLAVEAGIRPLLVLTKGDIGPLEPLARAYEAAGLAVIPVRYETGEGLAEIRSLLAGKLSAVCGNSGVGKSTLLNALDPEARRETGEISQKLNRGKHTTREVALLHLAGGLVADTPGFASLDTLQVGFIPKENLQFDFPEFAPYLGACRFTGCSHRTETGCRVRQAVEEGALSASRYRSYLTLYEEAAQQNEWERRTKAR